MTDAKPLKVGGRVAEVAVRSDDGAIDFVTNARAVEKWERA